MKNKTRDIDGFMLCNLRGNPYTLGRVMIYIAEREFEPTSEYAGIPRIDPGGTRGQRPQPC
jgi:hypothetical protein